MRIVYVILLAVALACGGEGGDLQGQPEVEFRIEPECPGAVDTQWWPGAFSCYWTCVSYQGVEYEWVQIVWHVGDKGWGPPVLTRWIEGSCH